MKLALTEDFINAHTNSRGKGGAALSQKDIDLCYLIGGMLEGQQHSIVCGKLLRDPNRRLSEKQLRKREVDYAVRKLKKQGMPITTWFFILKWFVIPLVERLLFGEPEAP